MNDSEGIRALRRELGRALKEARGAAGYSQAQLARKTGYARSTVSTVESGTQNVPRIFWERSDAALGAGASLIARYDRLAQGRVARFPHAAAGAGGPGEREAGRGLNAGVAAEAVAAYRQQGWPVEHEGGSDRAGMRGQGRGAGGAAVRGRGGGPLVAAHRGRTG